MMMNENRISDYFVISGVSEIDRHPQDEYHADFEPITDITVINRSNHEPIPAGYKCIERTPQNFEANLNHGSIKGSKFFICYKRGRNKPPLLDVGVFQNDHSQLVSQDCEIIKYTPSGFTANLNAGSTEIYLTYRRSTKSTPYNQLVVSDICVILSGKESPPHAFCLIDKNLNKGYFGFGSNAYLCYKKTMDRPPHLIYQPVIIDRYPKNDLSSYSLPQNLPMFCLPKGASIECWPRDDSNLTSLSTFILTTNVGTKIYATLLNYYEKIDHTVLTDDELLKIKFIENINDEELLQKALKTKNLRRIKSLCLLSQWPFFEQFKNFLNFIYVNFVDKPSSIPIEHYVFHFMNSIPFPSPDRQNILVNLSPSYEDLMFTQTFDDFPIPSNGASFKKLLQNLGPENCIHLLLFMLTEQKILLHSLRLSILTELAEALVAMIFPLNWNCPYIPLCPLNLAGVVNAPLPFILGFYSQYFDYFEPPNDVISIDLDTKAIYLSDNKRNLNIKLLPKKELRLLKERLEEVYKRIEMNIKIRDLQTRRKFDKQIELEILEAFLQFMASILKDFRRFLKPITAAPKIKATDPTTLFDFEGFIQSKEPYVQFYRLLTNTQMFTKFIEERSLVSNKNISFAFFDDCCEKVEKYERLNLHRYSKLNLLMNQEQQTKSSKTVFISIPFLISENDHHAESLKFDGHLDDDLLTKLQTKFGQSNLIGLKSVQSAADFTDSVRFESELECYAFVKRAKHEVLKAQKIAHQSHKSDCEWSRCLLINAYALWFTHFPVFSYEMFQLKPSILNNEDNSNDDQQLINETHPLSIAYQALQRMQTMNFSVPDEFCYRILMILCCIHNRPALAVKIFLDMKKYEVRLNAITYGYYNKAVLDGDWPNVSNSRWTKLCNVIRVVLHFQKHITATADAINDCDHQNEMLATEFIDKDLFEKSKKQSTSSMTIVDHCSAGILFLRKDLENRPNRTKKLLENRNDTSCRKRYKSCDDTGDSVAEDFKKILPTLNDRAEKTFDEIESSKKFPSSLSKTHLESGNDDLLEMDTGKRFSANSFVSPLKATFGNMDFSKSPMADKLRSSFRIAKRLTKTKYNFAHRSLQEPDKNTNKISSLFSKADFLSEETHNSTKGINESKSSSLSKNFDGTKQFLVPLSSTPTQSVAEFQSLRSQFQTYASPSEYFYSTVKSIGGRINEFKLSLGAVNAQSPVKFNMMNAVTSRFNPRPDDYYINQSIDNLLDAFDENSFHMEKYQKILDEYYRKPLLDLNESSSILWRIEIMSCTVCRQCQSIIYDEEIMCKWFADDSNLNTECIHCSSKFVPSLTIYIKDFRQSEDKEGHQLEPISVPYLSPLVLRKEFENILNTETYSTLMRSQFVDDHPIVYWNLIWYFDRLNLPTHITGLALVASTLNSAQMIEMNQAKNYGFQNIQVVCKWDDEKIYETTPLNYHWMKILKTINNEKSPNATTLDHKKLCEELIELIEEKNLTKPLLFLISERNRSKLIEKNARQSTNSLYRELLFLNLIQQPPALDIDIFDYEYNQAFESLSQKDRESILPQDNPLSTGALYCRNLFKRLSLLTK
ncbi:E3 ubiquitin-protein ligase [Sarcoptes scabiei]|nr:E3 ubiquitin-protein ligase [Sarcoptes scabiei]